MTVPVCTVIAGPNGAGKTTFALTYLWLPGVATCCERVAERVARGGHDIPAATIERRYFRSVWNLLKEYAAACTVTTCYDNSGSVPQLIFTQHGESRSVRDDARYQRLAEGVRS